MDRIINSYCSLWSINMTTEKDLWPGEKNESLTSYNWSCFLSKVENLAFWPNKLKEIIGVREKSVSELGNWLWIPGLLLTWFLRTQCLAFLGQTLKSSDFQRFGRKCFSEKLVEVRKSVSQKTLWKGLFQLKEPLLMDDSKKTSSHYLYLSLLESILNKNCLAQTSFRFRPSPQHHLRPTVVWEPN